MSIIELPDIIPVGGSQVLLTAETFGDIQDEDIVLILYQGSALPSGPLTFSQGLGLDLFKSLRHTNQVVGFYFKLNLVGTNNGNTPALVTNEDRFTDVSASQSLNGISRIFQGEYLWVLVQVSPTPLWKVFDLNTTSTYIG